jgi:hypothetical protein
VALAVLVPATSLAVASVSPWLVVPYLLAMAAILLPRHRDRAAASIPVGPAVRTEPQRATEDRSAQRTLQDGAPEATLEIRSTTETEPASLATSGVEASKPKRSKGKGRAKAVKSWDAVPVTWVKVGPGKFVRVEGAQVAGEPTLDVPGRAEPEQPESPSPAEEPILGGPGCEQPGSRSDERSPGELCEPGDDLLRLRRPGCEQPGPPLDAGEPTPALIHPAESEHEETPSVAEEPTPAPVPEVCEPIPEAVASQEVAVEAPALPDLEGWDEAGPSPADAPPVGVHQEAQLECVSEPVEPERPRLVTEEAAEDDRQGSGGPAVEVVGEESGEIEAVVAGNAPDTSAEIEPEVLPEPDIEPQAIAAAGGATPWYRRLLARLEGRRARGAGRGRDRRQRRGSSPRRRGRVRPSRTIRRGVWTHHPRAPPDRSSRFLIRGRRPSPVPAPN